MQGHSVPAVARRRHVKGIVAAGCASYTRKQIGRPDRSGQGKAGAKGLIMLWLRLRGISKSGAGGKLTEAEEAAIATASGSKPGDLVLLVADDNRNTLNEALGELRHELARALEAGQPG